MSYNPWDHAETLGVSVGWHPLKHSNGIWLPSHNRIILNNHLPQWAINAVLAHEVVHAEHHDPPGEVAKHERRANRIAAHRLIDPERLRELAATTSDYDRLCFELGVTRPMLVEYVHANQGLAVTTTIP